LPLILLMRIKMVARECNLGRHLTNHQGAAIAHQGVAVDCLGAAADHQGVAIAHQGAAADR
jgi:hypothetical protein